MTCITLTSDFGLRDGYVGAMKGAVLSIAPGVHLIDIAHNVPPHDIIHGAFVLAQSTPFFPRGTIHVGVIDPGVGGARKPICVKSQGQYFVGPDNGLFAPCAHAGGSWKAYQLTNEAFFHTEVSSTFHGRDIFAPVAAHLARGVTPEQLGPPIEKPCPLELPQLSIDGDTLTGEVVYIDHFGNAVTNIRRTDLTEHNPLNLRFSISGTVINGLVATYEHTKPGTPLALIDSSDLVEIAIRDGSAADALDLHRGTQVRIHAR